jgi:hypothetical protein
VNKFKEVGNQVANYDPAHAALPWAAVHFILQTTVNDVEIFSGMVEGIEKVHRDSITLRYVLSKHNNR